MEEISDIGRRLKELRISRGLSQADLSGNRLSDSYISLIESGRRIPSGPTIEYIARRLGCSPTYLTYGVEDEIAEYLQAALRDAQKKLADGMIPEALRLYEEMLTNSAATVLPGIHPQLAVGYAYALEEASRFAEAIAVWEGTEYIGPEYWATKMAALVRCYRRSGAPLEAESIGRNALHLTDEDSLERVLIGTELMAALSASDAHVRASALGNQLLTLVSEETDPRIRFNLLWQLAYSTTAPKEALEWARSAHSLAQSTGSMDSFRLDNSYAELLLSIDDRSAVHEALTTLKAAASHGQTPEDAAVRNTLLARAYLRVGDRQAVIRLRDELLDGTAGMSNIVRGRALASWGSATRNHDHKSLEYLTEGAGLLALAGLRDEAAVAWGDAADGYREIGNQNAELDAIKNALLCADLIPPSMPEAPYQARPGIELSTSPVSILVHSGQASGVYEQVYEQ